MPARRLPASGRMSAPLTAAAHDRPQLIRARCAGARLVFLSPVFATRSHPAGKPLGPVRFGLTARGAGVAVAALGGMNETRFRQMRELGAAGWGAIDAWQAD